MDNLLKLASESGNNIIVFIVVLIVGFVIAKPIYSSFIKAAKEKREYYAQEKQTLIEVVKENTQAMTKLTVFIESDADRCKVFEHSLEVDIGNIRDKVDKIHLLTNEMYDILIENIEMKVRGERANGQ